MPHIAILDFGGQYVENIRRCFLELGIGAEIYPWNVKPSELKDAKGIVFSGGPYSVYQKKAPLPSKEILKMDKPVLGLCYGHQSIAHLLGGKVEKGKIGEYGFAKLEVDGSERLFSGLRKGGVCWMSHGDVVSSLPKGFRVIASSPDSRIAAFRRGKIYGLQFHPEVSHTYRGSRILENFASICGCKTGSWDVREFLKGSQKEAEKIKEKAIIAVSGGVDSTVAAVLAKRTLGKLHAVHVDTGLMRNNESRHVSAMLAHAGIELEAIDASKRFIKSLKGTKSSDKKRKTIGEQFIRVFEEVAQKVGAEYLIQGTIAPDVIESTRGSARLAKKKHGGKIKLHHNVGGLPEKIGLKLYEPLRPLFKHQVRLLGKELGIHRSLLERQPFPGPGLAARIAGEVTMKKLRLLRNVTEVAEKELSIYHPSQYFAALVDGKTMDNFYLNIGETISDAWILKSEFVGVKGDERLLGNGIVIDAYPRPWLDVLKLQARITGSSKKICRVFWLLAGQPGGKNGIILRAVDTQDFMTASPARVDHAHIISVGEKICEKFGVGFVAYEITTKPPSTIEII